MYFDFERFSRTVQKVYQSCDGIAYTLNDVLSVFNYYFSVYERYMRRIHPYIKIAQIESIMCKMPIIFRTHAEYGEFYPSVDDYVLMIDRYFDTPYKCCDRNINHFFSGAIREMKYYETLY